MSWIKFLRVFIEFTLSKKHNYIKYKILRSLDRVIIELNNCKIFKKCAQQIGHIFFAHNKVFWYNLLAEFFCEVYD